MTFYLYTNDLHRQNIFDQTWIINQIIIINILHNKSHIYYNHYSIIKFIVFELIYYVINLILCFEQFVFVFLGMSIKLFSF